MAERVTVKVTIKNRLGLHARPAMDFVDLANTHDASITVTRSGQSVDGKSIMQMMMLAATKGTVLEITAEGADAHVACERLQGLVDNGFNED